MYLIPFTVRTTSQLTRITAALSDLPRQGTGALRITLSIHLSHVGPDMAKQHLRSLQPVLPTYLRAVSVA